MKLPEFLRRAAKRFASAVAAAAGPTIQKPLPLVPYQCKCGLEAWIAPSKRMVFLGVCDRCGLLVVRYPNQPPRPMSVHEIRGLAKRQPHLYAMLMDRAAQARLELLRQPGWSYERSAN